MTNEERTIIALKNQMEAQKKEYERQIETLKMQNAELKKQLETQKRKTDERDQTSRSLIRSNAYMRTEMTHLNRQVNAYQSRVF